MSQQPSLEPPLRPLQGIQTTVGHERLLSLNYLISKEDSTKVHTVNIPESENVNILKELIKSKKAGLAHLAASDFILWKVFIPVDDIDSTVANTMTRIRLRPLDELKDLFPEPLQKGHVHIIIDIDSDEVTSSSLTETCILPPRQVAVARHEFCKLRLATAPSTGARPKEFRKGQEKAPINCNRPYNTVKTLPLRLSHPVFGNFMDDCESFKPTPEDKTFVNKFVETMSLIYNVEKCRQTAILELFRTADIFMQPNTIIGTDYTTDGSAFAGQLLYALAELKDGVCSMDCEPYLQAALFFLEATRQYASKYLNSGLPCIIMLIFGPYIAFAGATWTGKPNVQMLSTAIPCHYHNSDIKMRDMLLRHLRAFRNASRSLEHYYQELQPGLSSQCNPTYPYPTSFISGPTTHTFRYLSELLSEYNFVFFGTLESAADRRKLCIKFTHQYGEDVHRFCAAKGHAPKLHAVQRLPGGFYMVVMDEIGEEYIDFYSFVHDRQEILTSSAYTNLKENIRRFLEEMHKDGWVHGDFRSANVMVKKSGLDGAFFLIDFDWSGKNREVVYPTFVNRTDVRRPVGADDGEPILAFHDVEMLSYF